MEYLKPAAEANGFVKTLNNMGYMTSTLDAFSEAFISFSASQKLPALDIGAAYGIATQAALAKGASVVANDIDPRHLEIIYAETPQHLKSRLNLLPGDFMNAELPAQSLSGILACRVLHFYTGEDIETAARKMFQWLAPRGRVYIVAETPYLKNFQSFIPIYEKRIDQGARWPGFIENVMEIAPERGAFLPKQMHLLDPAVLRRVFEDAGFTTLECKTIARTDFPIDIQLDGRESVGYVGEKR